MRGVKYLDILAIVDFLYYGEANVYQENLDSFLAIAEELQLKGLMGNTDKQVENEDFDEKSRPLPQTKPKFNKAKISRGSQDQDTQGSKSSRVKIEGTVAVANYFSGDLEDLEERVKSMMEKSQNQYRDGKHGKADICKVCGKEGMKSAMKDHIEANHLEGVIIPCKHCDRTFRSAETL